MNIQFPYVIGISGKAGSGKDYITQTFLVKELSQHKDYIIIALADYFKIDLIVKNIITREKAFGKKDKETRSKLQSKGKHGKKENGPLYWINILKEYINIYFNRGIKWIFITDIRTKDEINFIENDMKGIVVRVISPNRVKDRIKEEKMTDDMKNDISETDLDDYNFKLKIYNDYPEAQPLIDSVEIQCKQVCTEIYKFILSNFPFETKNLENGNIETEN